MWNRMNTNQSGSCGGGGSLRTGIFLWNRLGNDQRDDREQCCTEDDFGLHDGRDFVGEGFEGVRKLDVEGGFFWYDRFLRCGNYQMS